MTRTTDPAGPTRTPDTATSEPDGRRSYRNDQRSTLYLVKQVELAIRAQLDEALRPFGITPHQYTALSALAHREGLSSAQLARRSFVSAQAMNQLVFTLLNRGLIARTVDPTNRRVLRISLTAEGHAMLAACENDVRRLESRMLGPLSAREVTLLRTTLEHCREALTGAPAPVR